jgi:hypothetical protein
MKEDLMDGLSRAALLLLLGVLLYALPLSHGQGQPQRAPAGVTVQHERAVPPAEGTAYGTEFFSQLHTIFGQFSNADLARVFENAKSIQCSELVNSGGEWRTVAFFNRDSPELGAWYHKNIGEVQGDLNAFIFSGACSGDKGPVRLTTKVPVLESLDASKAGRIRQAEIEVNVNAPVTAAFDNQTQAYHFELPFMFLQGVQNGASVYALQPPKLATRDNYAPGVTSKWDCKDVSADDLKYQFLICRSGLTRNGRDVTSGAHVVYHILSDGKTATSSVKFSVADPPDPAVPSPDVVRTPAPRGKD